MNESAGDAGHVSANGGTTPGSHRWSLLLTRMAAGDAGALSNFYDEASPYVYAIAMRILRNQGDAEETVLDVFHQVWRLSGSYDPARCVAASWLAMMTRSRALDRWRSRQSRLRLLAPEQPEAANAPAPGLDAEARFALTEEQQRLRRALSALPPEQSRMISLAFWEGLSHAEVASRTGVPLGTVKTRIRLGMLKLREELKDADAAQ